MTKSRKATSEEMRAIDEYLRSKGRSPLDAVFTYAGQDMHERWPHIYKSQAEYEDELTAQLRKYLEPMPARLREHLKLLIDRYAERKGRNPAEEPAGGGTVDK